MIKDIIQDIKSGQNVRQNLILIKEELKEGAKKHAFLYHLNKEYEILTDLLHNEDAKIRKNTALVLGQLGVPEFLEHIYSAYQKEEQHFVKSSYLIAMKEFDYKKYLSQLKERFMTLSQIVVEENNKKHIQEELRALTTLIIKMEGIKQHKFNGYNKPSKVILLTNRNYKSITLEQVKQNKAKEFNAGIIINSHDLNELLPIRTYQELLFMLDDVTTCSNDPLVAAKEIAGSHLLAFLTDRHEGKPPFYFRIELKSKMDLSKKSVFTKKLAGELEHHTNRQLINSTSNYEFEIRLIENKNGQFNVLVKLFTLKDERYSYRKHVIATSIQPVNAALTVSLAKEYLKEEAQILDPFCGVGTMLIERHKFMKANTIYGLDIYEDAITKARENTLNAGIIAHYINRNFFDFKHEYLFDEIITNMPTVSGRKDDKEIFELYQRFFLKAKEVLKEEGLIILYSHNKDFVKRCMDKRWYKLEKEFELSKKEGCYLFIISSKS